MKRKKRNISETGKTQYSCTTQIYIANHSWTNDNIVYFEDGQVIDKGKNRTRKTLEPWHTAESDDKSKPPWEQYRTLRNNAPAGSRKLDIFNNY